MCRVFNSILALTAVAGLSGAALSSRGASIEGVWRTAQVTVNGQVITQIEPNLDIITAKHYSRVEIHAGPGARPNVADATNATADELRQMWGPVVAEAGSYEVTATTLTMRPVVSKNPASMGSGVFFSYRYRLAGDTLWLTPDRDNRGPAKSSPTIKLTRVE